MLLNELGHSSFITFPVYIKVASSIVDAILRVEKNANVSALIINLIRASTKGEVRREQKQPKGLFTIASATSSYVPTTQWNAHLIKAGGKISSGLVFLFALFAR